MTFKVDTSIKNIRKEVRHLVDLHSLYYYVLLELTVISSKLTPLWRISSALVRNNY